jgi:hypothetical protein
MATLHIRSGAQQRLERRMLDRVEREVAHPIQAEAARITAAEAVDTGLMAASWRIGRRLRSVVVGNTAHSPQRARYPAFLEFGYRHHQSGRHMPARRILARAIATAPRT